VTDVEIAVGLRWETRHHAIVSIGLEVCDDLLSNEVLRHIVTAVSVSF
jgi:hypothetical protein